MLNDTAFGGFGQKLERLHSAMQNQAGRQAGPGTISAPVRQATATAAQTGVPQTGGIFTNMGGFLDNAPASPLAKFGEHFPQDARDKLSGVPILGDLLGWLFGFGGGGGEYPQPNPQPNPQPQPEPYKAPTLAELYDDYKTGGTVGPEWYPQGPSIRDSRGMLPMPQKPRNSLIGGGGAGPADWSTNEGKYASYGKTLDQIEETNPELAKWMSPIEFSRTTTYK